jgi:hypothetical protein
MRNKMWLGLAGGGILLVGLVVGALINGGLPALALGSGAAAPTPGAASTPGAYCQLYLQTVAGDLHVSQAQLATANQDALKKVIEQAYKDGKITQAQETQALNKVSQLGSQPCAALGRFGHELGHGPRGLDGQALAGAHQAVLNAVAGTLGLQPSQLQSDLQAGQTVPQIAQAQKVQLTNVNSTYLAAVQAQLKSAVSAGKITQSQSDQVYAKIQQAVQAGHYPLLAGRDARA